MFIACRTQSRKQAAKVDEAMGEASGRTKVSGLVVRQELKRRLLRDASYLYDQLVMKEGFEETQHYLNRLRQHPFHGNKAGICLALMANITGSDDDDKTDRLKTKLRTLIMTCLSNFDSWLDQMERGSGCRCAVIDPVERKRSGRVTFELGENKCGDDSLCQVNLFLVMMSGPMDAIRAHLASAAETPSRKQLQAILSFLQAASDPGFNATDLNPCLTVGDLVIALESVAADCDEMYTMNHRDSRALCAALGQNLRILSHDPAVPDLVVPRPA